MFALLYDVHGNLPALEAVLEDAEGAGATGFVLGGDYALFGAWPAETVERLRALDATWIRGNVDRWSADPDEARMPGGSELPEWIRGAIGRCRELLGEETTAELGALPDQVVIEGVRYCHASPRSDLEGFSPLADDADSELLAGAGERRVVFGHTHLQFTRGGPGGIELVNPGSVGMPFDGDHRAAYALDRDGGVELRRVSYDYPASAAATRERLGEPGEIPAKRIEQARFDV